jgi:hypothetical protein
MSYIGKTTDGFGVRNRFVYVVSAGATSVSGVDANGATLKFTDGAYVDVYLNGILLKPTTDYNTSTANTIAGISSMSASDEVTVIVYDVFTVGDTVSASSGGTFSGGVTFDTDNVKIRSDNGALVFRRTTSETDIAKIQYVHGNPSLDIGGDGKNVRFINGSSYAETMRVGTNGNITIQDGDLVIGTAGHGIDFSTATDVGTGETTTSSILDDYEEGTFSVAEQNSSLGMTLNFADYTKIGRTVHFALGVTFASGSDSSSVQLTGMPFDGNNGKIQAVSVFTTYTGGQLIPIVQGSAIFMSKNNATVDITYTDVAGKYVRMSGTYQIL